MANNSAQDDIDEVEAEEDIRRMAPQVKQEVDWKQLKQKVQTDQPKTINSNDVISNRAISRKRLKSTKSKADFKGVVGGVAAMLNLPGGQAISTVKGKKDSNRGRGRPHGTYKTRILPDGTAVKVPTSVYKKMLSAQKTQMRLQRALQQARLSQQPPPDHVRGGGEGFDEDGIAEQMAAQQFNERQQRYQPAQRRPGIMAGAMGALGALGRKGASMMAPRQQDYSGYPQQPARISLMGGQQARMPMPSRVSPFGGPRTNILTAQNIFNNPGTMKLGVRR